MAIKSSDQQVAVDLYPIARPADCIRLLPTFKGKNDPLTPHMHIYTQKYSSQ
jgi:hypothetical protein